MVAEVGPGVGGEVALVAAVADARVLVHVVAEVLRGIEHLVAEGALQDVRRVGLVAVQGNLSYIRNE